MLVAYTDGITEAMNTEDEEWGEERFIAALKAAAGRPSADIAARIMDTATQFAACAPQHDDMTLVVLKSRDERQETSRNSKVEIRNWTVQLRISGLRAREERPALEATGCQFVRQKNESKAAGWLVSRLLPLVSAFRRCAG